MKYFREKELTCRCGCGCCMIDNELARKLDDARERYGLPMKVTSGFRCEAWNESVGGVPGSYHTKGMAVDISCTDSDDRFLMLVAFLAAGFRRIGIAKNFIHVDVGEFPLNSLWVYS